AARDGAGSRRELPWPPLQPDAGSAVTGTRSTHRGRPSSTLQGGGSQIAPGPGRRLPFAGMEATPETAWLALSRSPLLLLRSSWPWRSLAYLLAGLPLAL